MQITFYCPDRHIQYDGATADRTGVGGGITLRIRIADALAARGHRVSLICNCPRPDVHHNVAYLPLGRADRIECDVLLMHSSGGAVDLSGLLSIPVKAQTRISILSGSPLASGTEQLNPDVFYACSNFVRREILRTSPLIPPEKFFVSYHGVNRWNWAGLFHPPRDPRKLIYSSHPSKGLDASLAVLRRLRVKDPRFTFQYFGGNRLWGGAEEAPLEEPGVFYGGLIGQRRLAAQYQRSGFLMQLQTRPEPFGITVMEAMAAGCLVVASPVGALAELIRNGENGFLIEGDPAQPEVLDRAAELMWDVSRDRRLSDQVRRSALATPLDWETVAQVWEAHFAWLLDRNGSRPMEAAWARCVACRGTCLVLADGYHCTACGHYARHCAAG